MLVLKWKKDGLVYGNIPDRVDLEIETPRGIYPMKFTAGEDINCGDYVSVDDRGLLMRSRNQKGPTTIHTEINSDKLSRPITLMQIEFLNNMLEDLDITTLEAMITIEYDDKKRNIVLRFNNMHPVLYRRLKEGQSYE